MSSIALRRESPGSSCSSATSIFSTSAKSGSSRSGPAGALSIGIPPRRRLTTAQLSALQRMFERKSHPTKGERVALANEVGMAVKTVSVWFQNRRQTVKRSAPASQLQLWSSHERRHTPAAAAPRRRPGVSLDRIASMAELPAIGTAGAARAPLAPRDTNRRAGNAGAEDALWSHMPSSPVAAPPSSPTAECSRMLSLPVRAKLARSLEWACANARVMKYDEKYDFGSEGIAGCGQLFQSLERATKRTTEGSLSLKEGQETSVDTDTDDEMEAITPDGSSASLHVFSDCFVRQKALVQSPKRGLEDMDAAMVLLGLKGR